MATMEDLTKTQIVLLTLLISFVTSIATGIITTSLLAEAPASVVQTINRVVEHTIERVTPPVSAPGKNTTIISEDQAIISSIQKSTPSVVRIHMKLPDGTEKFYALGMIVTKDGSVLSDANSLVANATYSAALSDGSIVGIYVDKKDAEHGLALFKLTADSAHKNFAAISLASAAPLLGQSALALEGKESNSIALGRITALNSNAYETDITHNELPGSPLVNLSGELIGLKITSGDATLPVGTYVSLDLLKKFLSI